MSDPNIAIQTIKALHNCLAMDMGVQAVLGDPSRLYDSPPEDPVFPYLTYGELKCEDQSGDDTPLKLLKTSLHVWSRYAGRSEALEILRAVSEALQASPIILANGSKVLMTVPYMDVLRAADGRTRHGVLRLHLYVQADGDLS